MGKPRSEKIAPKFRELSLPPARLPGFAQVALGPAKRVEKGKRDQSGVVCHFCRHGRGSGKPLLRAKSCRCPVSRGVTTFVCENCLVEKCSAALKAEECLKCAKHCACNGGALLCQVYKRKQGGRAASAKPKRAARKTKRSRAAAAAAMAAALDSDAEQSEADAEEAEEEEEEEAEAAETPRAGPAPLAPPPPRTIGAHARAALPPSTCYTPAAGLRPRAASAAAGAENVPPSAFVNSTRLCEWTIPLGPSPLGGPSPAGYYESEALLANTIPHAAADGEPRRRSSGETTRMRLHFPLTQLR